MAKVYDCVILGAGILGLATAFKLSQKFPNLKLAIVEKEEAVAQAQTGHNSGVIHSGIYYKSGSLKAENCVQGSQELLRFCQEHEITYQVCGKLIVATSENELPRLEELFRQGQANGVPDLSMRSSENIQEIEPLVRALKAIYAPHVSIVDFFQVAKVLERLLKESGVDFFLSHEVKGISSSLKDHVVQTTKRDIYSHVLMNCTGVYCDRVFRMGLPEDELPLKIVPFRGEYYQLSEKLSRQVRGLVYPVPDPRFPFLGVHLTKMLNGSVKVGPNAVLSLSREGAFNFQDFWETVTYKGFWKLTKKYWDVGLSECYRTLSKNAFTREVQKLSPSISSQDLLAGSYGIRAQAVDTAGFLYDDFSIRVASNMIHVLNAPSPAATASLSIAKTLVKAFESLKS